MTAKAVGRVARAALLIVSAGAVAHAQSSVSVSPDVTIALGSANVVTTDHQVAADNQLGVVVLQNLGGIPDSADVIGYAEAGATGKLLTFDSTVPLPGGVVARPGDVVGWTGSSYLIYLDAAQAGIPSGVQTDAVGFAANGGLILSFDTDVSLPGSLRVADEDLVRWNGTAFNLVFDGSATGVDRSLDIDGVDAIGAASFLLSFDTAGTIGAVSFSDEDILRYSSGTWSLELDGSVLDADWGQADLDAFQVPEPSNGSLLAAGAMALVALAVRSGRARRGRPWRPVLAIAAASSGGAVCALLASPSLAADGAREINQTCAVNGGCFAGDSAGFPVTITASGSYRLTSNLTITSANTDGIVVSTKNVGIDLNGFAIVGPVVCSGAPVTCTPSTGTGSGVERTVRTNTDISVENGTISGMGSYGVLLGDHARVTNLRVTSNRLVGIQVDTASTVSANTAYQNGSHGIVASYGSVVSINASARNGASGIVASLEQSNLGLVVTNNSAFQNAGSGISASVGSTVSGNTAYDNTVSGISASVGSTVNGNTSVSNGGSGLFLSTNVPYSGNTVAGTTTVSLGRNTGGNSCNGTTTCP